MTRDEVKYTKVVRKHDPKLFVKENRQTKILEIYRENYDPESYDISDVTGNSDTLTASVPNHHYIMSLTDNWNQTGQPASWGYFPILERLGFIDSWSADSMASNWEKNNEKVDQSIQRDFDNQVESFAYEFRDSFKKTFSDVNTASMEKIDKRRIDDKKLEENLKLKEN